MLPAMGYDLPRSFFDGLEGVTPIKNVFGQDYKNGWTPAGAMKWYDSIIDDMLSHPGTSLTETAKRLGRHPNTVQTIVSSDLFKARWAQRRAEYEDMLNQKLVGKITRAADLALDVTIEHLEKKRDTIPLPILTELTKVTLDRLGYSPKTNEAAVQVNVSNNVVSAEALAAAREKLKQVEGKVLSSSVAGPGTTGSGEEDG
jgi:hypothetical protein